MAAVTRLAATSLHIFAGLRVRDFQAARPSYERLLGEPTFFPHATEAVWTLAEDRSVYVVEHADGAGNFVVTIFVDDLDAHVAARTQGALPRPRRQRTGIRRSAVRHRFIGLTAEPDGTPPRLRCARQKLRGSRGGLSRRGRGSCEALAGRGRSRWTRLGSQRALQRSRLCSRNGLVQRRRWSAGTLGWHPVGAPIEYRDRNEAGVLPALGRHLLLAKSMARRLLLLRER